MTPATLSRLGFTDTASALQDIAAVEELHVDGIAQLLPVLSEAADPDVALRGLVRVLESSGDARSLLTQLLSDDEHLRRLSAVLGASPALADHLVRHAEDVALLADTELGESRPTAGALRAELLQSVGADPLAPEPTASVDSEQFPASALDALRRGYRRLLLVVAARDLTARPDVSDVAGELADLAGAALEAALAIARAEVGLDARGVRIAVIGMGKCGGRELNYVSDVDVVYVVEPHDGVDEQDAVRIGERLAATLARACSAVTTEGSLWEVDAALRPEGKAGALVRTLDSHVAYYRRWAKTWEFQALLKARPVAGDRELGLAYAQAIGPLIWSAAGR